MGALSVLLTGNTCPSSGHVHVRVSNSCVGGISKRCASSSGQRRSGCVSSYWCFLSCPSPWHVESTSLRPPPPWPAPQPSVLGTPRPALAPGVWLPSASDLQMANPWGLPTPFCSRPEEPTPTEGALPPGGTKEAPPRACPCHLPVRSPSELARATSAWSTLLGPGHSSFAGFQLQPQGLWGCSTWDDT